MRIGSNKRLLRQRPGEVMGQFAFGHPFLDGNGRTMLVVHTELCHRASTVRGDDAVAGNHRDAEVSEQYREFERRGYRMEPAADDGAG